ncbi:hypothetical protein NPIL_526721 [Nephila pilipes]|uniref:Uncharacterized protein n=1 Tax=Nephila pilipes TaxID=299642 RepID=A0A8X6MPL4_NEPPI|nr:hypothetical protein NPIL_526721 [Nephila pilipes]
MTDTDRTQSGMLEAKEVFGLLQEMARLMNTGLDDETLAICVRLCNSNKGQFCSLAFLMSSFSCKYQWSLCGFFPTTVVTIVPELTNKRMQCFIFLGLSIFV